MGKELFFQNMDYLIPLTVLSGLLWLIFLWKEGFRYRKISFWINAVVSLIAIISLVLVYLKPYHLGQPSGERTVLLTENFKKNQRDSLLKSFPDIQQIIYQPNQEIFKDEVLPEELIILGDGLKKYDFWQLGAIPKIHYYPSDSLEGIIRLKYNQEIVVGDEVELKGLYQKPTKTNNLYLETEGGFVLDSVELSGNNLDSFGLRFSSKVPGNYLYQLVERDTLKRIVKTELIPLTIKPSKSFKILLLNSFPNFESKYLKNFLANQGHQLVVRNTISKGRYKYEYINKPDFRFSRFTKKNLKVFDLVILDVSIYLNLKESEKKTLKKAAEEIGLGIFIQPNSEISKKSIQKFLNLKLDKDGQESSSLLGIKEIDISKYPFYIKKNLTTIPIWEDANGNTIAAFNPLGNGKIGTSLVKETYPLLLNGNTNGYQSYWVKTINSIAKPRNTPVQWEDWTSYIYIDEPYEFKLRTKIKAPEVSLTEVYQIPLLQDPELSYVWKGKFYPKVEGWQTLTMAQDTLNNKDLYVMDAQQWKTLNTYHQKNQNRNLKRSSYVVNNYSKIHKQIPLWYFYLSFLICIGWLWVYGKIRG